jgi:cytidylate kinase
LTSKPSAVTIDGPAASGKSTLAIALAEYLNFLYFDTGVMYRGITLVALNGGNSLPTEERCVELARNTRIDVRPPSKQDGRLNDILIDGKDQTLEIRLPAVDAKVSVVSAYPDVRSALTKQQRRIALQGNVVMVGRDIGTVVLPEADIKIYLDASVEERARRRYSECKARGDEVDYEEVLRSMRKRDEIDSNRQVAPMKPADDAIIISSNEKTAQQVFIQIKAMLEERELLTAK